MNHIVSSRMLWVDSMRGFSMLIVVIGHVLISMGIGGYDSVLGSILLTFRMPLFFFVSGFFSYRAIDWWTRHRVYDILKRKFQAQIICTLFFCMIFYAIKGGSLKYGFGGYWFTIVLFQMYLIYLILSVLCKLFKTHSTIPILLIFSLSGIIILAFFNREEGGLWQFFCLENLFKYFQFFTFGIICSKYRSKFFSLITNRFIITVSIVGWIFCMLLWYNNGFHENYPLLYKFLHDILIRYLALITVIAAFYENSDKFSNNDKISKMLQFIGQRTLDIYMIHYFLLPDLVKYSSWLMPDNMIIIQIILASILTCAIVAICLLISGILRQSPILRGWLFGVKPIRRRA